MRKKTIFATIVAGGIFCAGYLGYADVQGLESVSSLIFLQTEKAKFEIYYFIIQVLNAKVENVNVRVMFWKVDQKH